VAKQNYNMGVRPPGSNSYFVFSRTVVKRIVDIQYNSLNLPNGLQFTNGNTTNYVYDASGQKLSVTHLTAVAGVVIPMTNVMTPLAPAQISSTFKTDYCGNVIYENGAVSKILTDEGYITFTGATPVYHYYLKDHQGNNRVVINQAGTVEQVNHYYPFGGLMGESTSGGVQPYKYNGKELDRVHGLDLFDYGRRFYDPTIARWVTPDPLCEVNRRWSPYRYAYNNPLRFIDPDGMLKEIYITGKKADDATNQLNSSTSLNITRDASTGKLSATGEAVTKNDQKLLEAINRKDVTVNITADGAKTTKGSAGENLLMVGGAFKGNTVKTETTTTTLDFGFEDAVGNVTMDITTTSTTVSTEQHVNPDVLGAMDAANGNREQGMLHETLESYNGGVISLKKGTSSPAAGQSGSVYSKAHNRAPSQGGTVTGKYWDAAGNPLPDAAGAVRVEMKRKGSVIMQYP